MPDQVDAEESFSEAAAASPPADYRLEEQVGFLIRRVHQRATAIFNRHFVDTGLSPVQFAVLVKVHDEGRISQNQLGRLVNLDSATTMGVVSRLAARKLLRRMLDPNDKRRTLLSITSAGLKSMEDSLRVGHAVTAETLSPITIEERTLLLTLLTKLS